MANEGTTIRVQRWLTELPQSDSEAGRRAREALIEHSRRRMEAVCRKSFFRSLAGSPVDWEDIYQEAALRLWKSLEAVRPATVREFFGLACEQIRRVMIDMCRKYSKQSQPIEADPTQSTLNPVSLAGWEDFWMQVETLPANLREAFDLLWIQELTQAEAAEVLGLDESTVKRRWRKARELLASHLP
jgi:RNA polymerase sigma factor (sigma-70 family)